MNAALAIGFATTGATLLVTLVLFVVDRILARRAQRREIRRVLVVRVLDAFDQSTRQLIRPAFVQAWTNSDLEFTLLTPRLMLDLDGADQHIVPWLLRQVQRMQISVSKKDRIEVRATVITRLIQWHAGSIKSSWFAKQLVADPLDRPFVVPGLIRLKKLGGDSWSWAQLLLVLAATTALLRRAAVR